ncbi:YceD family protein [Nakamurella endophytica]|uniref:Metal-binding protein n=1 Tax=Nakamurella endophytica TaxID=1748367 RepID=A0A917T239_9ACTN|nr:YceD family protein [Nakamurella endophytica]GGM06521.1 metal-binding protein [Nakamurella endophytica]
MTSLRPDPASPWVIDIRSLGRRPGTLKRWSGSPQLDQPLGLDLIAVPVGGRIRLDLRLEAVAEGVLVSGTADAVAEGECSRCLRPLAEEVHADLRELYAYPDSTTAATTDEDEIPRIVDDLIDTEPLVRDELVLALPLAPLCRPDCPGLCAQCGEPLDEVEPGHTHEILDPRWAALAGRFGAAQAQAGPHRESPDGSVAVASGEAAGPVDDLHHHTEE